MRRLLNVGAGLLIAAAVPATVLIESGTAGATTPNQVTCTGLKGSETTQSLSKCSGPASIVGTKPGKGVATSVANATAPAGYAEGSTTTWGKGGAGGTSTSGINYMIGGTTCGKKDLTVVETSTVLSATGNASILVGDTGTATVCVSTAKGTVKLAKGSSIGG